MIQPGQFTLEEILSQPHAWMETINQLENQHAEIEKFLRDSACDQVIFTGCGSTYYLSLAVSAFCEQVSGKTSRGVPASELWLDPEIYYPSNLSTLLVAVSRSGETTETLKACEAFKKTKHGQLLTLSCYPEQPLATLGDLNLVFAGGQERSVAQTRAFTTLYLAATVIASQLGEAKDVYSKLVGLPNACEKILIEARAMAFEFGNNRSLDRFYFLGSGARYGLACELSLKMKEMSLSHSEAFHFMEFRHGPKSMLTNTSLVIGLVSRKNYDNEMKVLHEMSLLGASTFVLAPEGGDISIDIAIPDDLMNVLYLPPGQLLAYERSIAAGLNPDKPHLLDAVVRL